MEEIYKGDLDGRELSISVNGPTISAKLKNDNSELSFTVSTDADKATEIALAINRAVAVAKGNAADETRRAQLKRDRTAQLQQLAAERDAYDKLEDKPKDASGNELPFNPAKQEALDHLSKLKAEGEL